MIAPPSEDKIVSILAERIKKSDQKAFHHLFDALWEGMYAYAKSILMDETVSKDIVQDIWMDYWIRRKSIENKKIKAYLYKAVRFKCYKHLRDSKLNNIQLGILDTLPSVSKADALYDFHHIQQKVQTSIASLPKRCREIYQLSRINGSTNQEIAEKFNISRRTVENQISTALKKVRTDLSLARINLFL